MDVRKYAVASFACLLMSLPHVAAATPISYNVLDLISGTASMSGTITTDGTLGVLSAANIIAWNLTLFDGSDSSQIVNGVNSSEVQVHGGALSATLTTLTFNFTSGLGARDFYFAAPIAGELCYTSFGNCWGTPGAGVWSVGGDLQSHFSAYNAPQVIASAAEASVPEPMTFTLVGSGLAGVVYRRRQKSRATRG